MLDDTGELVVVFNGEIYNYPDLREELEGKGYQFRSHCDTEVLLHLYRHRGLEMFGELRGMFAFAIWDARLRRLILARDPFGIKPLYVADDGKMVRFASQVKALLAGGGVAKKPSAAGHVGFLLWGSVPEPHTLYSTIRSIPAGHFMVYRDGGLQTERCFCGVRDVLAEGEEEALAGRREEEESLRDVVRDSVKRHLLSDVQVGVFLSSGRDSTTITALASECGADLHTFTLGFEEYRGTTEDETVLANTVAQQCGFPHVTEWIGPADFDIEAIIAAMDQPSIDGVNTYLVAQGASRLGLKVALSGLGGDEVFGGYPTFDTVPAMHRWVRRFPRIPGLTGLLDRVLPEVKSKYAGVLEYGQNFGEAYLLARCLNAPWRLKDLIDSRFLREGMEGLDTTCRLEATIRGISTAHRRMAALEMEWYMRNQLLRDMDWASMIHSVEVRVPLVDVVLLRAQARRRILWTKEDLSVTAATALPAEVLRKRKTGFCVPTARWLTEKIKLRSGRKLRPWANYLYERFGLHESFGAAPAALRPADAASGMTRP
jgi:asparagine synthase (glutamine-hydrolysing)